MKLLLHSDDKYKDSNPERVKSTGDLSTVLLLTYEDIHSDTNDVLNTRGYAISTLLIPKIFEVDEKDVLEETQLWTIIRPTIYYGGNRKSKIVYY